MDKKRPPFVAGNWKMHTTLFEAKGLIGAVIAACPDLTEADIIVLPPFTVLSEAAKLLRDTPVQLGAQNLFWEDKGAYTGEISGPMLADLGCRYVIVGHSERRQYFGETDSLVRKRLIAALKAGLKPILCIGETVAERETGITIPRVESQIRQCLEGLTAAQVRDVLIAYEPIWAIGTGKTATPDQAEEVHTFIRGALAERYGKENASYAILLYGGSVKPANAYALFRERNIDGFLVGSASLEAESFAQITREALRAFKEDK